MAFTPRTYIEIVYDMVAYVQTRTPLTDFSPGSVIRTLIEAAALEDDEQFFQMVQLLDLFALSTATGSDLDRRMADFNQYRLPAKKAFGKAQFADNSVKTSQIALDVVAGSISITIVDSNPFPVVGFPYTIRIGEGTPQVQDVDVSANNPTTGVLTLSPPLTDNAFVGNTVTLVTGATSRLIVAGTAIEAPNTAISPTKRYTTQETATIVSGNILSNLVRIQADVAGSLGNTGIRTVTKFTGGPPWTGATVLNLDTVEGGLEIEKDKDFHARGLNNIQSLSRGTPLAVRTGVLGVTDPETGQRVESANIVEDFANDIVYIYVDDGTGLTPDTASTGSSVLAVEVVGATSTIEVDNGEQFPSSGALLIEDDIGGGIGLAELVFYDQKNNNTLTLAGGAATTDVHEAGATATVVDVISASAEANQRRFKFQNFPVTTTSDRVFTKAPLGGWVRLVDGVDYRLNHGTGEFQIINPSGLVAGSQLVAGYRYYTNLISLVQKVLEGDPDDPENFPGIKAAGIFLQVLPPDVVRISVRASISAEENFLESDIQAPVRRALEDYVNSRKIGEDLIISKMIDAAHGVAGLRDIKISQPVSNQVVLETQLAKAQDADGKTLIVVV